MTGTAPPDIVTEAEVRAALDDVHDPCSEVAGVPAGIAEMGLVHSLRIDSTPAGAVVHVAIRVTEPTCLMGPALAAGARGRLASIPGVAAVDVTLSGNNDWMPSDMSVAYRTRLEAHRAAHRGDFTSRETSLGAPMRIRRR